MGTFWGARHEVQGQSWPGPRKLRASMTLLSEGGATVPANPAIAERPKSRMTTAERGAEMCHINELTRQLSVPRPTRKFRRTPREESVLLQHPPHQQNLRFSLRLSPRFCNLSHKGRGRAAAAPPHHLSPRWGEDWSAQPTKRSSESFRRTNARSPTQGRRFQHLRFS